MRKRTPLSKFEALAQNFIEGSLGRLLGGAITPSDIAAQLTRVMEDSQLDGVVADTYHVRLHLDDYKWVTETYPQLSADLVSLLSDLARQTQLSLMAEPLVKVMADESVSRYDIRVQALRRQEKNETTRLVPAQNIGAEVLAALAELDAYLVVDGRHHIPLNKPIINIGRRTHNDIVLDAATVSRSHAQIRWRYGRFILYDLSNRHGRTRVNGQAVTECVLQPGDVIGLSQVNLLYAEGRTVPKRSVSRLGTETQVMPAAAPEESE